MGAGNFNTNCLKGLQCPNCGSLGPFRIAAKSWFMVYDSGTDNHGDVEWDNNSAVICRACDHEGTIKSFDRPSMKCPKCSNRQFRARQTIHRDVVVDEDGDFVKELEVFDGNKPYGPYKCTECGEELDDLTPEEREQADNDAKADH